MATKSLLLAWLEEPATHRGLRFKGLRGAWDEWSYERLAELTFDVARGLRMFGVRRDERVVLVQGSGPWFVASFFAVLAVGAVPCPVAPPATFRNRAGYDDHVAGALTAAAASVALVDDELVERLDAVVEASASLVTILGVGQVTAEGRRVGGPLIPEASGLGLVQLTSGSSGRPRGVVVGASALASNVGAIQRWLAMTPDDVTATWLPTHHDMGLIGCLVTPVTAMSNLWVMPPEEFVRRPLEFLRCFGAGGAALTAMPTFAVAYLAKRVKPADLEGLDFSAWRALIVGAERIDPSVVDELVALLSPFGFSRSAVKPAYGLAEATLAVTTVALEESWRTVETTPGALGAAVAVGPGADAIRVTGCGRPLPGLEVDIVDDAGARVPDGHLGEIVVRGPSIAAGYALPGESLSRTSITDGELRTGDAGFVVDGELFVLGRLGDSVKVRGKSVFAEDIETAVAGRVPAHRTAATLGYLDERPTVVVVVERATEVETDAVYASALAAADGADVRVLPVARGTIPRTTSGKPRRAQLWRIVVEEYGARETVAAGTG